MSSRYVSGRGWIRTNISEQDGAWTPYASGKGSCCPAMDDV
ncbi:hypothetical protein ABZT28_47865 [Streptomyces sp. NPDC005388]